MIRIEAAAIRLDNGCLFALAPPARHHNVIQAIRAEGEEGDVSGDRQGFLTSTGKFVGRKPALRLAREAGQILRETAPAHGLFSEDVW